ncbi:MAG TPA: hypothetical protein VMO81_13705 [Aestuariivirgaceae bacterium]|nr:hypothetical protein [Aestuariivirgaceae bacterium]
MHPYHEIMLRPLVRDGGRIHQDSDMEMTKLYVLGPAAARGRRRRIVIAVPVIASSLIATVLLLGSIGW